MTGAFFVGYEMSAFVLRNLRFPASSEPDLEAEIARKLNLDKGAFQIERIIRKALDTRRFDHPIFDLTVQVTIPGRIPKHPDLSDMPPLQASPAPDIDSSDHHPYMIGMGPAGLFCALAMVENGLQPSLFDRGDPLEKRAASVESFWQKGILDEDSNVQYGEGGAGAFSDGKLTSRGNDPAVRRVFSELIRFGAPDDIAWEALPHLGTDGIRAVVSRIRNYLLEKGCRFHYRSKLEDIGIRYGHLEHVVINGQRHTPGLLVLALGNSARDTWQMLHERGLMLEPKPFALGFRIEQSQAVINASIYGSDKWAEILGPASYRLTAKTGYTFCMCPGGKVIAAATEPTGVVTNGMSFATRNDKFANSAVVTPVSVEDYGSGLWDGMLFQRSLETLVCRDKFEAPAQTALAFVKGLADDGSFTASYKPGIYQRDMTTLFPPAIAKRLRSALMRFTEILPEFIRDAVLIAPETRTSSPIRIIRHKERLSNPAAENIYPIGEGSGYAGGIISSAADGWRLGARIRPGSAD
jgi:uncharacterized FAD-dependent dehydrogenase